eukprot:3583441-Lingulodinium_polyedra.AAC.1
MRHSELAHVEVHETGPGECLEPSNGAKGPELAAPRVLHAPPNAAPGALVDQFRGEERKLHGNELFGPSSS